MLYPKDFQTLMMISAGIAHVWLVSQFGPSIPNHPSTVLKSPTSGR